ARRAIEGELAYLAASNATDENKIRLRAALDRQRDSMGRRDGLAEGDVEFHNIIAGMACNRFLATAIALIRQDTQLSPSLEYITRHAKRLTHYDHKKIYDCIIHTKPIEAKEAMIEHINNLILDVEKYWKKIVKIKS
ncbi:MAG: FadR/GntR family transcriptional regulator, partial [Sporomusa sp.]